MQDLIFKKLTLLDKPLIDKYFLVNQPKISEFTFTNLYIWGSRHEISYARYNEGLLLLLHNQGETYFLAPIGFSDCEGVFSFLTEYSMKHGIQSIKLINEHQKKFAKKSNFPLIEDRDNWDYVYKTKSLATLSGWRLDGKRGFVKKFIENYDYRYTLYDSSYRDLLLKFATDWANPRLEENPTLAEELEAIQIFLREFEHLDAKGAMILVNEQLVAFTFGEKLNDNTFVIHFEKANADYVGSYQMINQLFVKNELYGKYTLVNREQDLGIAGIRKAKQSYAPLKMIKKYTLLFHEAALKT